ncbi:ABC transporter permease subunit [Oceanospirillum linum]|uniref:Thiamine/thiamine pyrophosphate ABC transporter permease ThiP n=1 Tax=Oceanospirillum linum TaxID=966 RepID=A0A1T1HGP3_OCELI|nr:ABC transporter permease subunit [Oceanospirillum linum]OOV88897.1 thiamine/thiamine pyrophosphate ABC transporter permease ThiP [Oceanospirillum linum]SEF48359.1 thiamine transport system permease protein [Oleiphilus messinensis]SMP02795.1 thiamine transport system permease protein [Oceanospirillum linum]
MTHISDSRWLKSAAVVAYSLVILITTLAFYGLIGFDGAHLQVGLLTDPYILQILSFSLKQAGLSALLSVALALPVARALHFMPQLVAKKAFLSLCLLSFVMPTLVLITGLVSLMGRTGLITPILPNDWNLYGLNGILIAHIYLNTPLAIRVLSQQMAHIPDTSWRLARQLRFSRWQQFTHVEWPAIKPSLLMLLGFIFVLCFNSFAVVLALGGGPGSTTLEVAIYQALKYDFNLSEALTLAWLQFTLAGLIFALIARMGKLNWLSADTSSQRWQPVLGRRSQHLHRIFYYLSWGALLLPLLALLPTVSEAKLSNIDLPGLLQAAFFSLLLGFAAAILAMLLAWLLLIPIRRASLNRLENQRVVLQWLATHTLVAPAMVLSTGLYILLLPRIDLDHWGMCWLIFINSVLLLPFVIAQLKPRLLQFDLQYGRLSANLKLSISDHFSVIWPFIRSVTKGSFALALLLALGDVAVFSIFGNNTFATLPWLIYGYAGSYRMAEAALASLLLLAICALLVFIFERHQKTQTATSASDKMTRTPKND